MLRTAGQGLDADGAAARVEVEHPRAGHTITEDGEEGLFHAVGDRPRRRPARRDERMPPGDARDHPHQAASPSSSSGAKSRCRRASRGRRDSVWVAIHDAVGEVAGALRQLDMPGLEQRRDAQRRQP